jgi:hypothetical protein
MGGLSRSRWTHFSPSNFTLMCVFPRFRFIQIKKKIRVFTRWPFVRFLCNRKTCLLCT